MRGRQVGLLILGVAIVSFSAPMIRLADAPALTIAMYRNLFATAVLLPWALARHRGEMRAIRRSDVLTLVAAGLLLALHFATWVPSVVLTTVAASTVLVSTAPIWSAAMARIFLGQRLRRTVAVGIGIAFGGTILIAGLDFNLSPKAFAGDMLALIGAAAVAGHRLVALGPRRRLSLIPFVTIMYGVCSVALLVVVLVSGIQTTGFEAETWMWILLIAIGPQVVGHTLFNLLLKDVDPTVLATAIMGEAIGATLLAVAFFGEVPSAGTIAGAALLLVGIFITIRGQPRQAVAPPVE
jgi:drug/metabolite transporter (DMT)-like permease